MPNVLEITFYNANQGLSNVKNELLYVELEVGIMCWINLCKVWHMNHLKKIIQFVRIFCLL